jgi:hypothetical protein
MKTDWEKLCRDFLIGKTIAKVRYMTEQESTNSGFYRRPLVIEFQDGSWIFSMADDEGNDGGAYATSDGNLDTIPVM